MLRELIDSRRETNEERGQVMVIFAFAFVVIIMLMALLFDGGRALVLRRELKNASDAAAMAGANIIQSLSPKGCSSISNTSPVARAEVRAAVEASVAANMPGYDPTLIRIECANSGSEVRVQLDEQAPTFFGSIFNSGPLDVGVTSAAINGQDGGNQYSVILLNNSNLSWPVGRRGCPSFLLSGGPTVIFDSSIYVDSTCTRANGGALSTNGNSATLTLGSGGPQIRLTGEYAPGALTINPPPVEHVAAKPDPLASRLYQPAWWTPAYTPPLVDNRPPGATAFLGTNPTGLYVRRNGKLIINGQTQVLEPGVYKGGIELRSSAVALLHPGVYVIQGGGLKLGAQSSLYSVNYSVNTVPTNWATSCGNDTCGVMIYNTGDQTGAFALDQIDISAGATFKVRSYEAGANSPTSILNNGTHFSRTSYNQMLLWQAADPRATSTYGQPDVRLNGGGSVEMIGTVYAPQAKVNIGGGSGGSGGAQLNLTLQFIVWDMELSGNSTFHFVYDGNEFVVPPSYGLTE